MFLNNIHKRLCKFPRILLTPFWAFFTELSAQQRTEPTTSVLHPGLPSSISASSSFEITVLRTSRMFSSVIRFTIIVILINYTAKIHIIIEIKKFRNKNSGIYFYFSINFIERLTNLARSSPVSKPYSSNAISISSFT